jgi:hypothetical protein
MRLPIGFVLEGHISIHRNCSRNKLFGYKNFKVAKGIEKVAAKLIATFYSNLMKSQTSRL